MYRHVIIKLELNDRFLGQQLSFYKNDGMRMLIKDARTFELSRFNNFWQIVARCANKLRPESLLEWSKMNF